MRRALQTNEKSFIYFLAEQACEQETSSEISRRSLMSFLLFRSILRPASKDPEAHEGVGENRANGHGHEFGGIAPQRGIRNQRLQRLPCKPHQTIAIQDFERQDDDKAYHLPLRRSLLAPKRPVLVQEKTRHCSAAIGHRIVDHQN